jgi:hypothetical protein
MKERAVRVAIAVPTPLYRRLQRFAVARGVSIEELVLSGVNRILIEKEHPSSRRVKFPLIISEGPNVDVTNEQIYGQVGFP